MNTVAKKAGYAVAVVAASHVINHFLAKRNDKKNATPVNDGSESTPVYNVTTLPA